MQEPLPAGAGGDGFDRRLVGKKENKWGQYHFPPFCNMVSKVSKYFYSLIKDVLMRSVGQELPLTVVSGK